MGQFKVKTVSVALSDEKKIISHYQRMGFELLTDYHETLKTPAGAVIREMARLTFRFNFNQKNATELWRIYKQYEKKQRELRTLYVDKRDNGKNTNTKRQLAISGIWALITAFCYLTLVENPFDLLGGTADFVFNLFFALIIGSAIGMILGTVIESVYAYCTRNKRLFHAIEKISVLEKEIEELVQKATKLRM